MTTAKPSSMMSADQAVQALQGIDWKNVDWSKLLTVLQAVLSILAAPKMQALQCSAHDAVMHEAAEHALTAATLCLGCCDESKQ